MTKRAGLRSLTGCLCNRPEDAGDKHGSQTQRRWCLARLWGAVVPLTPPSLSFRFHTSWLVISPRPGLLSQFPGAHMVASWDQMWFRALVRVWDLGPGFPDSRQVFLPSLALSLLAVTS